jgi:hypothetical protein
VIPFGIHDDVPAETYHLDPCEKPSLSSSIARLLIDRSPAHAKAAHPKLNPQLDRVDEAKFDVGTVAHGLLLQGIELVEVIDAKDWRTKAAQEARDEARANGLIPLLPDQAERVLAMVAAAREQILTHTAQPSLFADGKPEQTLVWEDDHGVVCRVRVDWLHDDYTAIDDLKTTSASADPGKWTRTLYGMGADLQVAMYIRGVERLTGMKPAFRYVVCETYPPHALSVVDLAPAALALAEAKVQKAIDLWAWCLDADSWPGYDRRVASIELPTFEEMRWLEREGQAA